MNPFKKIIEIGLNKNASVLEKKRVRLLNTLSVIFVIVNLLLGIMVLVLQYQTEVALMHFTIVPLQILVMVFQYKRWFILARWWMWILTYFAVFYFSFFGDTTVNNEYYFSILALLPLIFFDNRAVHWVALVLSCFGFMSMDFYHLAIGAPLLHMNNSSFILFTMLFLVVKFFKNLNERQEKLMTLQRDKALQQTKIIESQKEELEELNRFQSKFFINISHELRTPLTLIGGAAQQLKKKISTEDDLINNISTQSDKITTIVDDILDITKSKFNKLEMNLQPVNLITLLKKIYTSFKAGYESKNKTLLLEGVDNLNIIINADLIYLERAMNNLLLNSLKYTATETGKVTLKVKQENDQSVSITITDNGIGVKSNELEKVFDRFYQGENHINKSGGTGVGLSFTKDIIQLHMGSISLESEEGKGTTVKIELPFVEVTQIEKIFEAEKSVNPELTAKESRTGKATVLVVDDHEDMRTYIGSLLENYAVVYAENGEEGLEKLKSSPIDFIITDYMMPIMDGFEFVKEIKRRKIYLPILVLTARTDLDGKLDILRLGVDDYITKPFNQEELLIRVGNSLNNFKERDKFIQEENIEVSPVEDPFLSDLRKLILKHIAEENFTLEDVCQEFVISKSSLYRKVKSLTGLSSNDFIREVKLVEARTLVETRKVQSLKELSYAVGFSKPSYFATLYQKRFGRRAFD